MKGGFLGGWTSAFTGLPNVFFFAVARFMASVVGFKGILQSCTFSLLWQEQ